MTDNFRVLYSILLFLISCGLREKPSKVTEEIEGKYVFNYPSGAVELIDIKLDKTFRQLIYSGEKSYLNSGKPLYENFGSWSVLGKKIEFDHWLTYCYLQNPDSILAKPYHGTVLNIAWYRSTDQHPAIIDFYSENGYFFKKVKNSE